MLETSFAQVSPSPFPPIPPYSGAPTLLDAPNYRELRPGSPSGSLGLTGRTTLAETQKGEPRRRQNSTRKAATAGPDCRATRDGFRRAVEPSLSARASHRQCTAQRLISRAIVAIRETSGSQTDPIAKNAGFLGGA
jgi:hypothetical protein